MPTLIADPRVHQALTHLMADHSEFGVLALNLTYKADSSLQAAMATDGTHCFYNPSRLDSRTDANNQFTIAHETLHCALDHIKRAAALRAEGFSHSEINEAADYAVNALLIAANVGTPAVGILHDPQYANLSMEQIARKRRAAQQPTPPPPPQQPTQPEDDDSNDATPEDDDDSSNADSTGDDDAQDDPQAEDDDTAGDAGDSSAPSDVPGDTDSTDSTDAGTDDGSQQASDAPGAGAHDLLEPADAGDDGTDAEPLTTADWQTALEQAFAVSSKAGTHSADLERAVQQTRQVDPSCWQTLRQFVESTVPTDTSWLRPNRRFIADGQYLPGTARDNTPPLAIAIDTSDSVTQPMLDEFAQHIEALANEFHPRAIHVIYADSSVRAVQTFEDGDEIKLDARGGGGTAFQPTFDHIATDTDTDYSEIAALIYITDLQAWDISTLVEPDYPVLWATPSYYRDAEPFGERVWLT